MKLDISDESVLIEVVSDCFSSNHMIYCINREGAIVEHYHIKNATIEEVIDIIPHIRILSFSDMDMWNVHCNCMFNRIFEPDFIHYNNIGAWNVGDLVDILLHFCDIKNVKDYELSEEYRVGGQLVYDYIHNRPTPIEVKSEKIHMQGVESRRKFLKLIPEFII